MLGQFLAQRDGLCLYLCMTSFRRKLCALFLCTPVLHLGRHTIMGVDCLCGPKKPRSVILKLPVCHNKLECFFCSRS